MPEVPDLTDPRYLNEVGWFVQHAEEERDEAGVSYDDERRAHSRRLLERVLEMCSRDQDWLRDKVVVSLGPGCTGDLSTWAAAAKVSVDPLLYTYQHLGLLLDDPPGVPPTVFLNASAEDVPLLDERAHLVLCRNALDHMLRPDKAIAEIWRILEPAGLAFIDVDVGGRPKPDEPTVFTEASLFDLLESARLEIVSERRGRSNSRWRDESIVVVVRKTGRMSPKLDRRSVLDAYVSQWSEETN